MAPSRTRRRKVLAILAGGVVVGIGAAYTLANWNDSEFAGGTFSTGTFNLEGSLDDATYADHATADAAAQLDAVEFVSETSNMSPGETAYDSFFVRLDEDTTVGGTVAQASIAATGASDEFSYKVVALGPGEPCDASRIDLGTVLGEGATLTENTATGTVDVAPGADGPGLAWQLCIEVQAAEDLTQGAATTATWEFQATSADAS